MTALLGVRLMTQATSRLERFVLVAVPCSLVVLGYCLSLLPHRYAHEILGFLAIWLWVSVPLGIAFGHCALSEG